MLFLAAVLGPRHVRSVQQLMGLVAQLRTRKARRLQPAAMGAAFAGLADDDIIEL